MENKKLELAKKALHKIAELFEDIDAADSVWAYIEDVGDFIYSQKELNGE